MALATRAAHWTSSIRSPATKPSLTSPCSAKSRAKPAAAIIGQTADLAPADKRLYGIRDVTATVESVPLITASILSKKLAAGLQHLVLDVKCGSGAFMADVTEARALATSLVAVANGAGLKPQPSSPTWMNLWPPCAGNAIEVAHAAEFLMHRSINSRVSDITLALGAELLLSAGIAKRYGDGPRHAGRNDRPPAKRLNILTAWLRPSVAHPTFSPTHDSILPRAPIIKPVYADDEGTVSAIDTRDLGLAVIELGGGRRVASDTINHAVGLENLLGKGFRADFETPLCMVHAQTEADFEKAEAIIKAAYVIGDSGASGPNIIERIAV